MASIQSPNSPPITTSNHHRKFSSNQSPPSNLPLLPFSSTKSRSLSLSLSQIRPRYFCHRFAVMESASASAAELELRGEKRPLRVMIAGAPASGKGTQCELITGKYGLVHISAGDLLRAEIACGSENGRLAKEHMEKGQLVPDEIVVRMVKERLLKPDSLEKGWLLDGYPRSLSQAMALQEYGIRPDVFILLDVPEDILVDRVVGRRLDPVTGRIYHLKYSPPENEEIAARLTQRFDDTEEKVKLRLQTHNKNVDAVLSVYENIIVKIDGSASKDEVFSQIDSVLSRLQEQKATAGTMAA
ncbi:hypothetical protein Drorol1_Dr00000713 [Drosera rotundifolia]